MANAVRTGPLSRNYQHRYFWIQACRLFHQRNLVQRVAIEKVELRAFDDVSAPTASRYTTPTVGKSMATTSSSSSTSTTPGRSDGRRPGQAPDPSAPPGVLAARHRLARSEPPAGGLPKRRLTLVTPWTIDDSDPVRQRLVSCATSGEMILDPLFDQGATREMKGLREVWRADLGGVSDDSSNPQAPCYPGQQASTTWIKSWAGR